MTKRRRDRRRLREATRRAAGFDMTTRATLVRAETADAEARTVEAVIATETPVTVFDFSRFEIVDEVLRMDGVRMPANGQLPLLDSHSRYTTSSVMGSTRNLRVDGDRLMGVNHFARHERAEEAWALTRDGHLTDNSVGYRVLTHRTIEARQSETVAGKRYTAGDRPLRVATSWQPRENSLVPIGADELAKMREEHELLTRNDPGPDGPARESHTRSSDMELFKKWLSARGLDFDSLDDQRRAELQAQFDAEMERAIVPAPPANDPPDPEPDPEPQPPEPEPAPAGGRSAEEERTRVTEILAAARDLDIDRSIVDEMIAQGASVADANARFLTEIRNARPRSVGAGPAIHARERQMSVQAISDGLLARCGAEQLLDERGNVVPDNVLDQRMDAARDYADASIMEVCRAALQMEGLSVPRSRNDILERAVSTASLSNILSNVSGQNLIMGFTSAPSTARRWCRLVDENDFKTVKGSRLGEADSLVKVNDAGEVRMGEAADEGEDYNVDQYAVTLTFTEKDMINDRLDAINGTPFKMGEAASRLEDDLVYTELLNNGNLSDGVPLFDASRNNLFTNNDLGRPGLQQAVQALREMKDVLNKQHLRIQYRPLIVPPALEDEAEELNTSPVVIGTNQTDFSNIYRGRFDVISEPRLADATFNPNASDGRWFLAGIAAQNEAFRLAFLRGRNRRPRINRYDTRAMNVLGVSWQVVHEVGVGVMSGKPIIRNDPTP